MNPGTPGAPATIGPYRVLGAIASDPERDVFAALDADLGREVALHVMRAQPARSPDAVERFVREARLAGRLAHPGIVPVFDAGTCEDGRPWFATPRLQARGFADFLDEADEGRDLSERERRDLLHVMEQVCDATAFAHARGVVHGDLAAERILLGTFGEVWLTDWNRASASPPADPHADVAALSVLLSRILGEPVDAGSARELADLARARIAATDERARNAQLDAAAARAETRAARRARRLTLALIVATLATVGLLSGGWAWQTRAREQRLGETSRKADEALAEASIRMRRGRWSAALAAADRALGLVEAGDPDPALSARVRAAHASITTRLETVRAQRQRERANEALLTELRDLRPAGPYLAQLMDWPELAQRYQEFFERFGVDPTQGDEEEVANALQARGSELPAKARGSELPLVAALDDWARAAGETGDRTTQRRLLRIVGHVDPDPTRAHLREAVLKGEPSRLRELAQDAATRALPPETLALLGRHLALRAPPSESLRFARMAQRQQPDDYVLTMDRASAELGIARDPRAAVRLYSAALALKPEDSQAQLALAIALTAAGQRAEAVASARAAVASHPDVALTHLVLGNALPSGEERIAEYRRASELEPRLAEARIRLAIELRLRGELDAAAAELRTVVASSSVSSEALTELGSVLHAQGDLDGAIRLFQRAIEQDSSNAVARLNLGNRLLDRDDVDGAVRELRVAVAQRPDDPHFLLSYGNALLAARDPVTAIGMLERAAVLDPGSRQTHALLGFACAQEGRESTAAGALRRAYELGMRDPLLADQLAWILATADDPELRDPAAAVRLAEEASNAAPDEADFLSTLGVALCAEGRFEESATALLLTFDLGGSSRPAVDRFFLAIGEHELGRPQLALDWFEEADAWLRDHPAADPPTPADRALARSRARAVDALRIESDRR